MRRPRPLCGAREPSGNYVQKPQRIDFAEVTRGWVFGAGPNLTQSHPEETVQLHSLGCLASPFKRETCRRGRGKTLCRFQLLVVGWDSDAQEDQNGTIQPHHIFVSKAADTPAVFAFGMVVILSTINRQTVRRRLPSLGSKGSRNRGASAGSVVNAHTVTEFVMSKRSS